VSEILKYFASKVSRNFYKLGRKLLQVIIKLSNSDVIVEKDDVGNDLFGKIVNSNENQSDMRSEIYSGSEREDWVI